MSDGDQSQARPQRSGAVQVPPSESPEFNDTPFGECVCCGSGAHGRESCRFLLFVQRYHAERQGEAYRWDAQLQLWTNVVTVGESETLEEAWLRREWLDVINKKMNRWAGAVNPSMCQRS